MPTLILVTCVIAFGLLASGTARQQGVVFGRKLGERASGIVWWAGWLVMALALLACVATRGWALGVVVYSGYTSFAAGVVYLALILRQRRHHIAYNARRATLSAPTTPLEHDDRSSQA